MPSCRFPSTDGERWKWTCCARKRGWSWNWTAASIWQNLDAYRRDRRKDALLQEHGYFVLRFLAEDVGAKLDMVLDAILRALTHRRASSGQG